MYPFPLSACDDAKIWVWDIPEGGLKETLSEPRGTLRGHMEKIYFVIFHPLARDIIVTSAYDFTVRIWDLSAMEEVIQLCVHPDQVWKWFFFIINDNYLHIIAADNLIIDMYMPNGYL